MSVDDAVKALISQELTEVDQALETQIGINAAQDEVNAAQAAINANQADIDSAIMARLDALEAPDPDPDPDPTGPTITEGPEVTALDQTSATVRWTMSEVCSGQIEYGTTTALGSLTAFQDIAGGYSTHIQKISGLSPGTTYYYRTVSTDADGVTTRSDIAHFTTTPAGGGGGGPMPRFPASAPLAFVDWTGSGDILEPGHLQWVKDPHFDILITRITPDGEDWRAQYPKRPAWNADESRMWLGRGAGQLLDGQTLEPLGDFPYVNSRMVWSAVDPDLAFQTGGSTDNRLYRLNPGVSEPVVVARFDDYSRVDSTPEGRQSLDDRWHALATNSGAGAIMYDAQTDDIVGSITLPAAIDHIETSPNGEFIMVRFKDKGTAWGQGIWVLDQKCEPIHGAAVLSGSHADVMRDGGLNDVIVGYYGNSFVKVRMDTGGRIPILEPALGGHICGTAFKRPGWAYISNHYHDYGKAGWDQIMAVKLDGSREVQSFGNARTVQRHVSDSFVAGRYKYEYSTHAVASPSGDRVTWGGGFKRWLTGNTVAHGFVAKVA